MGQQNIGNIEIVLVGAGDNLTDFPGGVYDRAAMAGNILDQVNEIFHGPQFH
jgi:hypothetical protein